MAPTGKGPLTGQEVVGIVKEVGKDYTLYDLFIYGVFIGQAEEQEVNGATIWRVLK